MAGRQHGEKIDWDAMEPDWRANVKTKKQLAEEYGVSRAAIDKHWKKRKISRDLTAKIKAEAGSRVTRATVTPGVTPDTKVTEQEVVAANAQVLADIQINHRQDIPNKRALVAKLFAELEELTDGQAVVEQMVTALEQGDQDKLADAARKVASLPQRIKGVADLVGSYKALIMLERQAFNMDDTRPGGNDDPATMTRAELEAAARGETQ